jgi:hypothetical protein
MTRKQATIISGCSFHASTGLAATGALLAPRGLFAAADAVGARGLVEKAWNEAASATITVQRLRGNVSLLMGAGGKWLHSAGATILGHENTRKHLSTDTRVEGWTSPLPLRPPVPKRTR